MSANGLQNVDRKDRGPSPTASGSSHGNVVDHNAPHGKSILARLYGRLKLTHPVTEDHTTRRVGGHAQGGAPMIHVQPLRATELQVCNHGSPINSVAHHCSFRPPMQRIWASVRCVWSSCIDTKSGIHPHADQAWNLRFMHSGTGIRRRVLWCDTLLPMPQPIPQCPPR